MYHFKWEIVLNNEKWKIYVKNLRQTRLFVFIKNVGDKSVECLLKACLSYYGTKSHNKSKYIRGTHM